MPSPQPQKIIQKRMFVTSFVASCGAGFNHYLKNLQSLCGSIKMS